jgi:hypothetical protein
MRPGAAPVPADVADQPFVPHSASIIALAMNRLRHAYLKIEPGLEPYFTTGHHDDERGLLACRSSKRRGPRWWPVRWWRSWRCGGRWSPRLVVEPLDTA